MRLNWKLRRHAYRYIVRQNGADFDVFYRNLRRDVATGGNIQEEIYIGTVRRESALPELNIIGRPVFYYTRDPALQDHPALLAAIGTVRRCPRATAVMQM